MRKRKKGRKFNRVRKVRKALFKALLRSLVLKGRIKTTEAKAKEIRPKIERLVTKAKKGSLVKRREVLKVLDQKAVRKLFSEIAPRYQDRSGGYVRITKLAPRKRDAARMAIIEFV